jgi:hypothetical protein
MSWRDIASQPAGAQPSWWVEIVSATEVVERRRARDMGRKHAVVPGDRAVEHVAQAGLAGILPARTLVEFDTGLGREGLESLRKRDRVALHHEAEHVAAQAAAKALPALPVGSHIEGGGLLTVERAQPLERCTRFLELDGLADDIDDRQPVLDFRGDADSHGPSSRTSAPR